MLYSGRTTYPDDESDRIDVCDGTSENQAGPELRLPRDYPGDSLQAAGIGSEALEADQGINLLTLVVSNVKFKDGEQVRDQSDRSAAWAHTPNLTITHLGRTK